MPNDLYQGIIVFQRSTLYFGDYPWASYFSPTAKGKYDAYVKEGYIPDEQNDGFEVPILEHRWLGRPLDWDTIRKVGKEIEAKHKKN